MGVTPYKTMADPNVRGGRVARLVKFWGLLKGVLGYLSEKKVEYISCLGVGVEKGANFALSQ